MSSSKNNNHTIIIIGCSGIGLSAARRLASNRTIILGARSQSTLDAAKSSLQNEGYAKIETLQVQISSKDSVQSFAQKAAEFGVIDVIVHTAGVSAATAESVQQIVEVDLLGAAYVIDAFVEYATQGTSVIVTSSIAAHLTFSVPPTPQKLINSSSLQQHWAFGSIDDLLNHPDWTALYGLLDAGLAYTVAKVANNRRVEGAAIAYGRKGARINSLSPGLVLTSMGRAELEGKSGDRIKAMVGSSPANRAATATDVVNVVAFLAGPESQYMTGSDVRVDGGGVSALKWSLHEASKLEEEGRDGGVP